MSIKNGQINETLGHHHWQAHVKALSRSGLSRAEYCRRRGISYHALTYWCRKLARTDDNLERRLVPAGVLHGPCRTRVQRGSAPLRITCLPGNLTVEVENDFSPSALSRLLAVLEQR